MSEHAPSPGPGGRLNPAALSLPNAARVLTSIGGRPVTEAMLQADLDAGAPVNSDGTINLVHYAAWLVKQMADRGGGMEGAVGD